MSFESTVFCAAFHSVACVVSNWQLRSSKPVLPTALQAPQLLLPQVHQVLVPAPVAAVALAQAIEQVRACIQHPTCMW